MADVRFLGGNERFLSVEPEWDDSVGTRKIVSIAKMPIFRFFMDQFSKQKIFLEQIFLIINIIAATSTKRHNKNTAMKLSSLVLLAAAPASGFAFAPAAFSPRQATSLNAFDLLKAQTGQSAMDPAVIDRYNALPFPKDKILAEYVWVDAEGQPRSKTRTLPAEKAKSVDSLPKWNFDGSSTGQAPGDDSEVILRPCRIFKDPFRPRDDGVDNILVMCDTWTPQGDALPTNNRAKGKLRNLFIYKKED